MGRWCWEREWENPSYWVTSGSWTLQLLDWTMLQWEMTAHLNRPCHSQLVLRAPWVLLCPKGTAQAKYGTENNSSLEMRERPVSRAQCSNHKHKLMVCLLAMQRRCHEFESQRNGQQHLSISSWMFKEPLASYSFQTQSHLFGEK